MFCDNRNVSSPDKGLQMATEADFPRPKRRPEPEGPRPVSRAEEEQKTPLLDFLLVVAEHSRLIVALAVALSIAGVALALLLPVRYTATVTILPPQQNSSLSTALMSQLGNLGSIASLAGGGSLNLKNPNDMYVAMLKSEIVEDAMIQRFGLQKEYHKKYLSDARKAFEKRTKLEGGLKDGLIRISIENKNPQRAAAIANGYVEQLRDLSEHLAITEASQRRVFFEKQLTQTKEQLTHAETAMEGAENKTGLIQLDSQARALIESGAMLRAQIAAKEVQIQGMHTYATGENAAVAQAEQELAGLRSQLAALGGSETTESGDVIVSKGKIPAAGLEYLRKLRDVRYYEAEFSILARQLELAKLDEAKQGALIQVVDPAQPPDKRSFPQRTLIVVSAGLAGLALGILIALLSAGAERARRNAGVREKLVRIKTAVKAAIPMRRRWTQ